MSLLADANKTTGRWVLMPRRGERFMGPRERNRARARRRRRHVFVALIDAIVITLLIGLVPPLRVMLIGTVILVVLLIAYAALLVQIKLTEASRRVRRRTRSYRSVAEMSRAVTTRSGGWHEGEVGRPWGANGNGYAGNGHIGYGRDGYVDEEYGDAMDGRGYGEASHLGNGHSLSRNGGSPGYGSVGIDTGRNGASANGTSRNGLSGNGPPRVGSMHAGPGYSSNGNGWHDPESDGSAESDDVFRLIDEDVHVIVRRARDVEAGGPVSAAN